MYFKSNCKSKLKFWTHISRLIPHESITFSCIHNQMTRYKQADFADEDTSSIGSIHLNETITSPAMHIRYHTARVSAKQQKVEKTLKIAVYHLFFWCDFYDHCFYCVDNIVVARSQQTGEDPVGESGRFYCGPDYRHCDLYLVLDWRIGASNSTRSAAHDWYRFMNLKTKQQYVWFLSNVDADEYNVAAPCLKEQCIHAASEILHSIDQSVKPCDDFYAFSCNQWIKNNPIPDGKSMWGTFGKLEQQNQLVVKNVLGKCGTVFDSRCFICKKFDGFT